MSIGYCHENNSRNDVSRLQELPEGVRVERRGAASCGSGDRLGEAKDLACLTPCGDGASIPGAEIGGTLDQRRI